MAGRRTALKSGLAWALTAAVLVGLVGLLGLDSRPSVSAQSQNTDATLSALTLSGVDFGTFASGTTTYTATVESTVTETTVRPTTNHSGASYVIKLGGVAGDDATISLGAGDNVIAVEVTAEDGDTTQTYTVTVTRTASTDTSLDGLAMTGIDLGIGPGRSSYVRPFKANVYHSVSETTVTATLDDSRATYVVKVGGVEDTDRTISLAVGSNVVTVDVTAEDGTTTETHTATINRAAADDATTGVLSTDDPPMNLRVLYLDLGYVQLGMNYPRNRGIIRLEVQRYEHNGTEFVSSGPVDRINRTFSRDLGGAYTFLGTGFGQSPTPGALYKYVVTLKDSEGSTVIEESITLRVPSFGRSIYEHADSTASQQADASLSALTLGGVVYAQDHGGHGCCNGFNRGEYLTFAPETHAYESNAPNSLSQLTVTPTLSQSGASYVIKKGGVTDSDGTVPLDVGTNFITVEVTAPDDTHFRIYYLTIIRVEAGSATDATLSGLTLSGIDFGTFSSATTSYAVTVADTVSETTVTPTVNDSDAYYEVRNNDSLYFTDTPAVRLTEGNNVITVLVTAEDDATRNIYTVNVARGQAFLLRGSVYNIENATENDSTFSMSYYARDNSSSRQNKAVTWSLTGDDSGDFTITNDERNFGVLTFTSTPDYETPTDADTDNVYNVTVNATDGANTITRDVTVTVTDADEDPTGAPTISGTAQVGQTLTAETSGIADPDGLDNVSYSYQWLADDTDIDGATSSTYAVQSSDNGKVIKVRVTFTDDAGNSESLTSAGTAAVVTGGL
ncbi:MAG: cadherin-like beta sandwich domain-containing protein [Chloroflexi bacterium]|nr:cadherin-like beta sandwich domain-containing protein [Chloroflexota bacterium]